MEVEVTMENKVIETIQNRRSIRRYKQKQITDEELDKIIEAGCYAPSGGNNQSSHFVVIQSLETLNELKALVVEEFSKMEIKEDTYKSLKASILQSKKGNYDFTYHAPTLILISNLRGYGNAMADCSVALENMMLAATSLKIGSCWVNQLKWLADNYAVKNYIKKFDINEDEIICGGIVLGYSDQNDLPPIERKGNHVTFIK